MNKSAPAACQLATTCASLVGGVHIEVAWIIFIQKIYGLYDLNHQTVEERRCKDFCRVDTKINKNMVSDFSDCSQNNVDQSRCLMGSPGVLVALLTTASQFYFLIGFLPFSSAFNWRDHTYYNAFLHFYFILFLQLEWIF